MRRRVQTVLFMLAVAAATTPGAQAGSKRKQVAPPPPALEAISKPVVAIVSLNEQRVSFYDANGLSVRAPISSGQHGLDTPSGIYSVLQKDIDHRSNVYDDAAMPFMQRITWTGLALHAGVLPGYPASHGCVRMPYSFAEQIFSLTDVGMRVVISPDDFAPVAITHPFLAKLSPPALEAAAQPTKVATNSVADGFATAPTDADRSAAREKVFASLKANAAAADAAAQRAAAAASEAKDAFDADSSARARAAKALRSADVERRSANDQLTRAAGALTVAQVAASADIETARKAVASAVAASQQTAEVLDTARASAEDAATQLEFAKANFDTAAKNSPRQKETRVALAKRKRELASAQSRLRDAISDKRAANKRVADAQQDVFDASQPRTLKRKQDAKDKAQARGAAAEAAYATAAAQLESAEERLATSKAKSADAEAAKAAAATAATLALGRSRPVSLFVSLKTHRLYVRQAFTPVVDVPITITDPAKPIGTHVFTAVDFQGQTDNLRWTAVAVGRKYAAEPRKKRVAAAGGGEPMQTNPQDGTAVLDRLVMPPEIIERYSGYVLPGSSLIVSDEPMSTETGSATDFIVVMNDEPQGGLRSRKSEVDAARQKKRKKDDDRFDRDRDRDRPDRPFFLFW